MILIGWFRLATSIEWCLFYSSLVVVSTVKSGRSTKFSEGFVIYFICIVYVSPVGFDFSCYTTQKSRLKVQNTSQKGGLLYFVLHYGLQTRQKCYRKTAVNNDFLLVLYDLLTSNVKYCVLIFLSHFLFCGLRGLFSKLSDNKYYNIYRWEK